MKKLNLLIIGALFFLCSKAQEIKLNLNNQSKKPDYFLFSPDNRFLFTCADRENIKMWDIVLKKYVKSFPYGRMIGIVDNGKNILIADEVGLKKYEILSGKCVKEIKLNLTAPYYHYEYDFSKNEKYFAFVGNDKYVYVLDIQNETFVYSDKSNIEDCRIALSPEGKYIATAHGQSNKIQYDKQLKITDILTKEVVSSITVPGVKSITFNDENNIYYMTCTDSVYHSNLTQYKKDFFTIGRNLNSQLTQCITLSKNQQFLFLIKDEAGYGLYQYDMKSKKLLNNFNDFDFCKPIISNNSELLVYACKSNDNKLPFVIRNLKDNSISYTFEGFSSKFDKIAVNNNFVAFGIDDYGVKLYDYKANKFIDSAKIDRGFYNAIKLNKRDSNFLWAANNGNLVIFDLLNKKKANYYFSNLKNWNISRNNKYLCDNKLNIIDLKSKNIIIQSDKFKIPYKDEIIVDISNNNQSIAVSASSEGGKYYNGIWDISNHDNPVEIYSDQEYSNPNSFLFSPDDRFLLVIKYGKSYIYDMISKQKIFKFDEKVEGAFFIDNLTLAIYNTDKKVCVYNIKGNQFTLKYTFTDFGSDIVDITTISGLPVLVCAENSGYLTFWDFIQGKKILNLYISNKDWVVIDQNNRFDGTINGIKSLHFVKGLEVIPLESIYEQYFTPKLLERVLGNEQLEKPIVKVDELKPKPEVKIISPNADIRGFKPLNSTLQSEQQTIEITVQVTDLGGGIDEILLYQNDKLLETTNRGFKVVEQTNDIKTKTFSVTLVNGINKFKATAFNNQRTEAIPVELSINYLGQQVNKPNLYLLVIGINEYKNSKYNLNYAIADAQGFKEQIEQGSKTIFGNIKNIYLTNADATKTRITQEISNIESIAKQEDVFIFYYAGHGVMSEEQVPLFYIIPHDVTQLYGNEQLLKNNGISANELKQFSTEIKAQKQMYILDACQSGGMVGMLASRGAAEEKALHQLARSTGTYWLAASNSDQFAGEFAQLGHGIFTYCILQGLSGKADAQNDKKITVQEISSYVNDQVPILSKQYKGSEQYPNTYGYGNDFPIIIVK